MHLHLKQPVLMLITYLHSGGRNNTGFLKKQVTIHTYFADILMS